MAEGAIEEIGVARVASAPMPASPEERGYPEGICHVELGRVQWTFGGAIC